ncbi:MAG: PPC domain-containing protein [bacterium]|nr:PPC domain-containing protein [bacterium]
MSALARWRGGGLRVIWAVVCAAAMLGSAVSVVGAADKGQVPGDGWAVDFGDISDVPKTVVNRVIGDAEGGVERYRFELSSPQSVEVVLRRLNANADVFLEDGVGEVLGSGVELGRSDERFSLTLAAGTYEVRVESAGPVRYRLKLKVTEPVGEPVGRSTSESPVDPETDTTDPQSETDIGTDPGTDPVEAWTAVLDVGANDDGVGYSRWAQMGSVTPDYFDVDGSSYGVILLAEIAGGLFLGLRRSLDTEFMLEVDGERFAASQSLVPNGLPLRGAYWWPTDGVLSGSAGSSVAVSLHAGADSLPERGSAPPGAWFSQVPGSHDGASQFSLKLNFDESDLGVTAALLQDALAVTGGSLATVADASPVGRTWEIAVAPDGPGDVTVSLVAASDCVSTTSVCSADGRMLRNTPQASISGLDDHADEASEGTPLPLDTAVRGQIETSQDEDWFSVELTKGHSYQIELGGPALAYVHEVRDPSGNVISEEGGSGGTPAYQRIPENPKSTKSGQLPRSVPSNTPSGDGSDSDVMAFGDGWAQITPKQTATYYVSARSDKGTGDYEVTLRQVVDDYPADTTTTGTVAVGGSATGEIEQAGDADWFEVVLEKGKAYLVDLMGAQTGDGTLRDPYLAGIHNSSGTRIAGTSNDDRGAGTNSRVRFTPASDGTYYVAARGAGDRIGTYTLAVAEQLDDFSANITTLGAVPVGGTAPGLIEAEGDHDWFKVVLEANKTYRFDVKGKQLFQSRNGTLKNPYIDSLYRSDGTRIPGTHINDGGSYWDARIDYTATTAGTYYLSAGGYGEGTYTVAVTDITGGAPDDYAADTTTAGEIDVGGTAAGEVQFHGDDDWFAVTLEANQTYYIDLMALHLGKGTLDWPSLHGIHDSTGAMVAGTANNDTFDGPSTSDREVFTPASDGVYYVAAGGPRLFVREGTYAVRVTDMTPGQADDYPATTASTATIAADSSVTARNEQAGDRDWYKVTLTKNKVYRFDLMGAWSGDGTLDDPVLHGIRRDNGTLIAGTGDNDSGTYSNSRVFYTPSTTGDYFVDAGGPGEGTYTLAVTNITDSHPDDYDATTPGTNITLGMLDIGGSATGDVGHPGDRDWFAVSLEAGTIYQFDLKGGPTGDGLPGFGTLGDPYLHGIHNSGGTRIAGTSDDDGGVHNYSRVRYRATQTGTHYVSAGGDSGTFTLFAAALGSDDHPANTTTTSTVTVGGSATGEIEREGDRDWFAVTLVAGTTYRIELKGTRTRDGTLRDPYLHGIHNSSGTRIAGTSDDDSGIGSNSLITFTAAHSGVHYLSAGADRDWTGSYTLYVTET